MHCLQLRPLLDSHLGTKGRGCAHDVLTAHSDPSVYCVLPVVQIRVIIERLVRRCGVEPVAAACPPDDYKLMAHIRKQQSRKERRRAGSEAGSQVCTHDLFTHRGTPVKVASGTYLPRSVCARTEDTCIGPCFLANSSNLCKLT